MKRQLNQRHLLMYHAFARTKYIISKSFVPTEQAFKDSQEPVIAHLANRC